MFNFLRGRSALVLNLMILVQAAGFYSLSRKEDAPAVVPLQNLPAQLGEWRSVETLDLDPETARILHPDDYVLRTYEDPSGRRRASLFVAYFRTQRTGHAPHTPRNCLPGNGWAPSRSGEISIPIEGRPSTIQVNRIVVARGHEKSMVLYWYLTPTRVVAGEYAARFRLVLDSIRHNRSDTALVRVVTPVEGDDEAGAERSAAGFAGVAHSAIRSHIPVLF